MPGREDARLDRVQHFRGAAAVFLDAVRVAVEDLEHGQGAAVLGQLAGHVIGGGEGHQRVEADVILAAERPRVRQRRGGHELLELGPRAELLDKDRNEVPDGRFLHQADERFETSERQSLAAAVIVGPGGREAHVERRAEANAGDQHAPADVPEETPTRALCSHRPRPFSCNLRSARRQAWWTGPSGAFETDPRSSYPPRTAASTGKQTLADIGMKVDVVGRKKLAFLDRPSRRRRYSCESRRPGQRLSLRRP